MIERPVIYVKRITNLSDARYCAGMGADLLGFVANEDHEDYVSPQAFKEIMSWVSGPRRVIELMDWPAGGINDILSNYAPDLIHLSGKAALSQVLPDFPLILEPGVKGSEQPLNVGNLKIEFIVVPSDSGNSEILKLKPPKFSILLALSEHSSIDGLLQRSGASGFMLQGSRELKPGLKDYDHLSRILEELDI